MKSNYLLINRKLHIHSGLLLLFFIWLFSLTGLILNHGGWKFASFWPERKETTRRFIVPFSILHDSLPQFKIMTFLNETGELQQSSRDIQTMKFRIVSPGNVSDISLDLATGAGIEKRLTFNMWGKLRTMHTFNGMTKENPGQRPNWWVTNTWRISMDVVAVGLIVMSLSSWIMWYIVRKEYPLGYLILGISMVLTCYFIAG